MAQSFSTAKPVTYYTCLWIFVVLLPDDSVWWLFFVYITHIFFFLFVLFRLQITSHMWNYDLWMSAGTWTFFCGNFEIIVIFLLVLILQNVCRTAEWFDKLSFRGLFIFWVWFFFFWRLLKGIGHQDWRLTSRLCSSSWPGKYLFTFSMSEGRVLELACSLKATYIMASQTPYIGI